MAIQEISSATNAIIATSLVVAILAQVFATAAAVTSSAVAGAASIAASAQSGAADPLSAGGGITPILLGAQRFTSSADLPVPVSNVQLGPGLCVARVPRNGRNFEYLSGEDPFLGYTLVQPVIKGIQGQGVIANAKHYM